MVHLLKQKSKVTVQHKPRVKYPIKPIFKKSKIDKNITLEDRKLVDQALGLSIAGRTATKIEATILEKYDEPMAN